MAALTVEFGAIPSIDVKNQTSCTDEHVLTAEYVKGGNPVWLKNGEKISPVRKGESGIVTYQAYAEGAGCVSDTVTFTVAYNALPVVRVEDQIACATENYTLLASSTGGKLVWYDAEGRVLPSNIVDAPNGGSNVAYYKVRAEGTCGVSEMKSFSVTFGMPPHVEVADQTSCDKTHTLIADAKGSGALKWLDESGTPIQQTQTITDNDLPKAYTYKVYADGGSAACLSDTATFTVTYGAAPVLPNVKNLSTCDTMLMLTTDKTGGELKWYSDREATLAVSNPVHGVAGSVYTYYVKAVDGGCESAVAAVTVDFGSEPSVDVKDQTSCTDEHVLTADVKGGSLVWLEAGTKISPVTRGKSDVVTYQVYAEGDGCMSDTSTFTVTYGVPPIVTVSDGFACDTVYVLSADKTGGTLKWYEADGSTEIKTPMVTGSRGTVVQYYVKAVGGVDCESPMKPFTVTYGAKPGVEVFDQTSCDKTHTLIAKVLGGSGTLKWLDDLENPIQQTQTITDADGDLPKSYTYKVYADAGSCQSDIATFTVKYGASPEIEVRSPQTICGNTYMLDASTTGGLLKWYQDDETTVVTNPVSVAGSDPVEVTYKLKAVDGTCESAMVPFTVKFNTQPEVKMFDQTTCGTTLTLEAEKTAGSLVWLNSANTVIGNTVSGNKNDIHNYKVYANDGGCISDTVNFTVAFGAAPYAVGLPQIITSCDASGARLFFEKLSDTKATYQWLDAKQQALTGGTTNPFAVTKEGMYHLQVSGTEAGCASVTPVEVIFNQSPVAEGLLDTVTSCTKEAELFFDNLTIAGATYEWYKSKNATGISMGTANPLKVGAAGDYSLKITKDGCSETIIPVYVKLETPPVPQGLPEVVSSCGGPEAYLSFTLSDRNATFAWWKAGVEIGSANPQKVTESGTYDLKIQGKGCADAVVRQVEVQMGGSRPLANAGVDQTIPTAGGAVQLFGTVTGGTAPYKYKWKPGASLNKDTIQAPKSVVLTEATEFYLQVTDKAGCVSNVDTIKVTLDADAFKVMATADPQDICMNNTSQLNVTLTGVDETGVSYNWVGDNLSGKTLKNPVFTPSVAGNYTFAVEVKKGSNTTLALTTVEVGNGEAPVLSLDLPVIDGGCVNDTIWVENTNESVTVNGYEWYVNNTPSGTGDYFVLPSGTYKLQVVADAGTCKSDTLTKSVTVGTPPTLRWIVEPANEVTAGQSITGKVGVNVDAAGTPPYKYTWSPALLAEFDSTFTITAKGRTYNFEVYATDDRGCYSDTLKKKTTVLSAGNLALALDVSNNGQICKEGVALLDATIGSATTAPYTFEWFKDGEETPVRSITTNELSDRYVVAYADFVAASQNYYVQVNDGKVDGMSTDRQDVVLNKNVNTAPKVKVTQKEQTILSGASTVLLAEPVVDGNYLWTWSPADKLMSEAEAALHYPQTVALTADQEYQVYISDANCVSAPDTAKVKISTDGYMLRAVTPDTVLCIGNTVLLKVAATGKNIAGLTYEWKVGDDVLSSAKDTATYRAAAAGIYVAVVTAKVNNKVMAAARVNITVNGATAPAFNLLANANSCQKDTVKVEQVGAIQAVSYEWRVNGLLTTTTTDRYVLTGDPGTYKFEVLGHSADGCRSEIDTATLKIALTPEIVRVTMLDSCDQAVLEVKADNALNYTWRMISGTGGAVNPLDSKQYIVKGLGEFSVEVKAINNGCSVTALYEGNVYERPRVSKINIDPSGVVNNGQDITATAVANGGENPYVYHWQRPGLREDDNNKYVHTAKYAKEIFEVYVTDVNGCISDTVSTEKTVIGGILEVQLSSRYGDVCRDGAAILDVRALGFGMRCKLELYEGNNLISTKANTTSQDTFWVFPTAGVTYKVVAVSIADNSVKAENTVTLSVSGNTAPRISAGHDMTVRMNGSTILMGTSLDNRTDYYWIWSPADKLASAADTMLQYPQTARLQTAQKYTVYAVDNQRCLSKPSTTQVKVDNVNGFTVEITPENPEVCKNGLLSLQAVIREGRVSDQVKYEWSPDDYLDVLNTSEVVFNAPASDGKYQKVVLVSDGALYSAAKTAVNVLAKEGFTLDWAEGRMACVGDTLKVVAGIPGLKYTWKVNGLEVSVGSDSIFTLGMTDRNKVEVFAKQTSGNGCASNVLTQDINVGKVPVVDILQSAFAAVKDSVFSLNIVDPTALNGCTYEWSSKPENKFTSGDQEILISTPLAQDVRYIYKASSPQDPRCQASDSVKVYLVPEAPAVTIKGNADKSNIILSWNRVEGADEYVVKYTENDPYNILGNGYKEAKNGAVAQSANPTFEWQETAIREMSFYQVMARRNIAELGSQPLVSAVTDTVGFKIYSIERNVNKTQNNLIVLIFDPEYCGFKTTKELGDFLTNENVNAFRKWNFNTQAWQAALYNKVSGWDKNKFDLEIYQTYQIEAKKAFKLLLYGKLQPQIIFDLKKNTNGKLSHEQVFVKLNRSDITSLKLIGEDITDRYTSAVRKWNFATQAWVSSTYNSKKGWSTATGHDVKIGDPIRILMSNPVKW